MVLDVRLFACPPRGLLETRKKYAKRLEGLLHDYLGELIFVDKNKIISISPIGVFKPRYFLIMIDTPQKMEA